MRDKRQAIIKRAEMGDPEAYSEAVKLATRMEDHELLSHLKGVAEKFLSDAKEMVHAYWLEHERIHGEIHVDVEGGEEVTYDIDGPCYISAKWAGSASILVTYNYITGGSPKGDPLRVENGWRSVDVTGPHVKDRQIVVRGINSGAEVKVKVVRPGTPLF